MGVASDHVLEAGHRRVRGGRRLLVVCAHPPPKAEQKLPAFTALNPYGKVPAWRDAEGFDLYESRAIMQHVCEGPPLIPPTAKERALMNQWLWVDQCSFKPAFDPIFYQKVLKKVPALCST